jgi:hypothetical protein
MDPELIKLLIEGGSSAVIVFMLYDMRREQRDMNARVWTLLEWLVRDKADAEGVPPPKMLS